MKKPEEKLAEIIRSSMGEFVGKEVSDDVRRMIESTLSKTICDFENEQIEVEVDENDETMVHIKFPLPQGVTPQTDWNILCPKCGCEMLPVYGWMWTFDCLVCPERDCDFVIDLETSTVPEDCEW